MKNRKIALLLDVDNVKIGGEAFNELYGKLNATGDVVYCKFYGYNDRKHLYLSEAIANFGYETAPFMRFKKRFSQLDNRMIVDAVKLNYTKPEINTYCIVAGDGDLIPALVELKSNGKVTIDINTPYQEQNKHMFDEHITVNSLGLEAEVYASKKPATKRTAAAKTVKSTVSPVKTKTVAEPRYKVEETVVRERVAPKPAPARPAVEAPRRGEYPDARTEVDLAEILRDITNRYSELDFDSDDDMDKKIQLIADIEDLISKENAKGEGMNSRNADVSQIFVDLQGIVDDMKTSL